jgi:heme/copper-type cytochrome/quinol oxidase subunit 1
MSLGRLPLFMYGTLTASFSIIFALPSLSVACVFLYLDRRFGTHFFDPSNGGSAILWQHLFWIFGHPWVYIVVLPALSFVSMIIPTFARRPIVGYTWNALGVVMTGVIGFGVWVHHMFATGLPPMAMSFFSAASMTVVIPSAISIFVWLATIWQGRVVLTTSMLFAIGLLLFVINFFWSLFHGPRAGDNPWDASSLEWATSSPPPAYDFAAISIVGSRDPLWEERLGMGRRSSIHEGPTLAGPGKETLQTSTLDGEPVAILRRRPRSSRTSSSATTTSGRGTRSGRLTMLPG